MKQYLGLLFRCCASGVLLYVVMQHFRGVPNWGLLGHAQLFFLINAVSVLLLTQVFSAYKWYFIGREIFHIFSSFISYTQLYFAGYFYMMFFPGGQLVGEGMKLIRMNDPSATKMRVGASLIFDRLTGFVALGILMTLSFVLTPELGNEIVDLIILAVVIGVTLVAILALFYTKIIFWVSRFMKVRWRAKVLIFKEQFQEAAHYKKSILLSIVLAVFAHTLSAYTAQLLLQSLNIHVPFLYVVWMYLSLGIAMVLPISYAGIGLREGTFLYYLSRLGIAHDLAISSAFLFFIIQVFVALLGGIIEIKKIWFR
jgi:hypothetical protein